LPYDEVVYRHAKLDVGVKPVLINPPALDGTDPQSSLRPGLLVADTYRLAEQLGAGSMGSVWKAQHLMLGHGVAIKFLHASLDAYPQGRIRFEREGKLAARLGEASRHICRVTEFGVLPTGTPFVVMELLQGEELARRLKREPALDLKLVAQIVAQLCRALTVAHRADVVHRDLKPANVFLCAAEDGQGVFVKLLDFGVAHAPLEDDTEGTRQGIVFGTPSYTSPEQISGEPIDGRADLWSVAVLTYRMATGSAPFGSGTLHEIGLRILTVDPPAPSSLRPELPPEFDAWMKKALAKQRDQRFASALELSEALLAASMAPPRANGVVRAAQRADGRTARGPGAMATRSRQLIALLALVLIALLAVWILGPSGARERPHANPARAGRSQAIGSPAAKAQTPHEVVAPPPQAADGLAAPAPPLSASGSVVETVVPPALAAEPPQQPAARERARRPTRASQAKKRAPAADPLKARAAELWNKTDEL
jgi:tRNA A-37 threonylcarbamoyl transferase component Bud32